MVQKNNYLGWAAGTLLPGVLLMTVSPWVGRYGHPVVMAALSLLIVGVILLAAGLGRASRL